MRPVQIERQFGLTREPKELVGFFRMEFGTTQTKWRYNWSDLPIQQGAP
jgi:hypothetical protein